MIGVVVLVVVVDVNVVVTVAVVVTVVFVVEVVFSVVVLLISAVVVVVVLVICGRITEVVDVDEVVCGVDLVLSGAGQKLAFKHLKWIKIGHVFGCAMDNITNSGVEVSKL